MEKKTALQEVFSELERLHPQLFNVYTNEGKEFLNHFYDFLAIERRQIIKAFKEGAKYEYHFIKNSSPKINEHEYYNDNYKI